MSDDGDISQIHGVTVSELAAPSKKQVPGSLRTGHAARIAAQYSQEKPKNNEFYGCFKAFALLRK
ncbi:MAG: hypothetical protein EKK40_05715 [Bradyrhizobiaceae bacterium]|nr:MAG: hypothetical protein EKK40_05715 [Bradyrhizobiaceae bacterium]